MRENKLKFPGSYLMSLGENIILSKIINDIYTLFICIRILIAVRNFKIKYMEWVRDKYQMIAHLI